MRKTVSASPAELDSLLNTHTWPEAKGTEFQD